MKRVQIQAGDTTPQKLAKLAAIVISSKETLDAEASPASMHFDDLDLLEFSMAIEQEFKVDVDDDFEKTIYSLSFSQSAPLVEELISKQRAA